MEDGPPPQKKQDVKMDAKDADINLLAMTDLSQCKKKDPGDVAVEQGHARCSIWLALSAIPAHSRRRIYVVRAFAVIASLMVDILQYGGDGH